MKNKRRGNTHPIFKTFSEVFFSNRFAIPMAPSSPIPSFSAVQHTKHDNKNIQPSVKETITIDG
jgi:hypothetical protein